MQYKIEKSSDVCINGEVVGDWWADAKGIRSFDTQEQAQQFLDISPYIKKMQKEGEKYRVTESEEWDNETSQKITNKANARQYDKKLIKWVKAHYWDSLEKDKHLILRHLRTFTGDIEDTQPVNSQDAKKRRL